MKVIGCIIGTALGIWLFSLCIGCKKATITPAATTSSTFKDSVTSYVQWQWNPKTWDVTSKSWTRGFWQASPSTGQYPKSEISSIYADLPNWTLIPAYVGYYKDTVYCINSCAVDYDSNLFKLSNYGAVGYGGWINMKVVIKK